MSIYILKDEPRSKAYGYMDKREGLQWAENLTEEAPANYVEEISRVSDRTKPLILLSELWKETPDEGLYLETFNSLSENDQRGFEEDLENTSLYQKHIDVLTKGNVNTNYRYIPYGYTSHQVEQLYALINGRAKIQDENLAEVQGALEQRSSEANIYKAVEEYARRIKVMYFLDDIQDAYDIIEVAYQLTSDE